MNQPELIKNIPFSEAHTLVNLVDYANGRVVSRTFAQNETGRQAFGQTRGAAICPSQDRAQGRPTRSRPPGQSAPWLFHAGHADTWTDCDP